MIEPCLPSVGEQPPTGPGWVHEIKHDGYRLMARRDALSVGIRLLTKNGHDWASRYPLILQAVRRLKVRSCLIDGEAVCCNERGVSSFEKLRHRSHDAEVFLVAFDLLELDGQDLRREPLEVRKQTPQVTAANFVRPKPLAGLTQVKKLTVRKSGIQARHLYISARKRSGLRHADKLAYPVKPLHVESLDRPIRAHEKQGNHPAGVIVDMQFPCHSTPQPQCGFHARNPWFGCSQ